MNPRFILCLFLLFVAEEIFGQTAQRYPGQINKGVIKFKVSGKNLPDKDPGFGTSDCYVEVFYTENNRTSETKIKRSETISNNENPVWSTIFEFNYDRTKNQQIHFVIWDDDTGIDDKVGKAWLDANDYVDGGQLAYVPVYKQGYLKVERLELNAPAAPRTWPETQRIKFQVSATNLPDKDKFGTIDPYVEIYSADGITGSEVKIGRTGTLNDQTNPKWGEVFEYAYDAKKNQRWVFKIYDDDSLREDESGGFGYVDLQDYMRKGQSIVVNLSKRGKLYVNKL